MEPKVHFYETKTVNGLKSDSVYIFRMFLFQDQF
jgi:hypothetical protein